MNGAAVGQAGLRWARLGCDGPGWVEVGQAGLRWARLGSDGPVWAAGVFAGFSSLLTAGVLGSVKSEQLYMPDPESSRSLARPAVHKPCVPLPALKVQPLCTPPPPHPCARWRAPPPPPPVCQMESTPPPPCARWRALWKDIEPQIQNCRQSAIIRALWCEVLQSHRNQGSAIDPRPWCDVLQWNQGSVMFFSGTRAWCEVLQWNQGLVCGSAVELGLFEVLQWNQGSMMFCSGTRAL